MLDKFETDIGGNVGVGVFVTVCSGVFVGGRVIVEAGPGGTGVDAGAETALQPTRKSTGISDGILFIFISLS